MRSLMISLLVVLCVSAVSFAADSGNSNFRLYSGGILGDKEVNGIFDLLHEPSGMNFIFQDDHTLWDDHNDDFRTSFTTGSLLGRLNFESAYLHSKSDDEENYTSMVGYSLKSSLTLRVGVVENEVARGIAGAKFSPGRFVADVSVLQEGGNPQFQGYASLNFSLNFIDDGLVGYASLGTKTAENYMFQMVAVQGDGYSAYHWLHVDNEDNEVSGKLLVIPSGAKMGLAFYEIASHYFTSPDYRVYSDECAWGWIPPDMFKVDGNIGHWALALNWENTPDDVDLCVTSWYRFGEGLGGRLAADAEYSKIEKQWTPTGIIGIYSVIPGTPCEVEVIADHDFDTGETTATVYAGVTLKF